MDRKFSLVEPHPSVSGHYIGGGRGGAGNYKRYAAKELTQGPNASGPASLAKLSGPRNITVGRGGAGNKLVASPTEQAMFQFDEEMVARREHLAPVYHFGRGGAANYIDETKPRNQRHGSNASTASTASTDSVRRSIDGVFSKLTQKLSRQA